MDGVIRASNSNSQFAQRKVAIELPSSEPSIELIAHATMDPAGASFTCHVTMNTLHLEVPIRWITTGWVTCTIQTWKLSHSKRNQKLNIPALSLQTL